MKNVIPEFGRSIAAGFKNTFNFTGTSSKREFWFFLLFFFIAYVFVWVVDDVFLESTVNVKNLPMGDLIPAGYVDPEVGLAVLLFRPIMAIPTLSVTVRRLHDVGKSGWWSTLWVLPLPVIGWFWLIPWLLRPSKHA
ncbi:MAG: DUF805 domain-containing protein [Gammaproteobacteria bacterium]|nr:DUF805 domain-containing protein [Gammaproteobacteria bacterium]